MGSKYVYPTQSADFKRCKLRWDLPLSQRKPGGQFFVVVECECGGQRPVAIGDTKRGDFSGLCSTCFRREHGGTLNGRGTKSTRYKGPTRMNMFGYREVALYPGDRFYEERLSGQKAKHGKDRVCYMLEHRHVMACHLGRALEAWEQVHHKDGDKANNALDNLEVLDGHTHSAITRIEAENTRLRKEVDRLRSILARRPHGEGRTG